MPKTDFTKLGFYSDHLIHLISPTVQIGTVGKQQI